MLEALLLFHIVYSTFGECFEVVKATTVESIFQRAESIALEIRIDNHHVVGRQPSYKTQLENTAAALSLEAVRISISLQEKRIHISKEIKQIITSLRF